MSGAVGGVLGLLHGAQGQAADHGLLRSPCNLIQQLLYLARMNLIARCMKRVPEIPDKGSQTAHFFTVRLLMNPVYKGLSLPVIILCHSLIGRQHEIFNQTGGRIAFIWPDINGISLFIQNHLRLRKIKIYGSPLSSPLSKEGRHLRHLLQHGNQLRIECCLHRIIVQHLLYPCVAESAIHTDHRLRNGMADNLTFLVNGHDAAQGQAILPCIQRADSVGEIARQHGNHPVRQIDAGAPVQSFLIKGAVLLHIVGHIRDMHAQHVIVALSAQRNRVVQILRVLAVDGDADLIPQIQPSGPIRL